MQRQSLGGSPSSPPLHPDHDDDDKSAKSPSKPRRFSISSPSSSSLLPASPPSPLPPQHKFVHAIPLLTLLCFLVLFLFSHDPSPSDLAQFKGFTRASDLTGTNDNAKYIRNEMDVQGGFRGGGEAVGLKSWRNLQESNKSRINRKFADF